MGKGHILFWPEEIDNAMLDMWDILYDNIKPYRVENTYPDGHTKVYKVYCESEHFKDNNEEHEYTYEFIANEQLDRSIVDLINHNYELYKSLDIKIHKYITTRWDFRMIDLHEYENKTSM